MGSSRFGEPAVYEVLEPKATSIVRLSVLLVTMLLFLSQLVLVGGPQESVILEASPDIVDTWSQVVNWTDPQDGETNVPLDKTVRVAVLGNYTLGNQVDWTVTPVVGGLTVAWVFDTYGNPILEVYHDPFEPCTVYTFNMTFYDDLMNPYDPYEFSFITLCGSQPPTPPILLSAVLGGAGSQDVILTWQLSADDGTGENDVDNYAIYHSDGYEHGGTGYEFLASVPAGTNTFTHSLAGDGDLFNHFYYVQANDTSGNTNWSGQAGKFLIPLKTGKQIASIPLVQKDTTLEVVLQSLEGSYRHVRYYKSSDQSHHWKSYWTFKTYRTLFDIDHTMGFWIDIVKPDDLVVAGLVPVVTEIELGHGWNFVGYPSFIERTLGEALSNMDWAQAQGYDDNPPFNLEQLSESDVMTAGEAYWVWVDLPQVWEVSCAPSLPPYIMWTHPADGQMNIPLGECILISFSEPMDPSSVTFSVIPTTPLVATWLNSTVLQICPADAWNDCTAYTVQVVAGQSMGGKPLVPGPVPNPWTFSTNCCVCYIVNTDPYDGEVDVPLDKPISIAFSEEMNPTTLNHSSNPDPGGWGVNWSTDNTVLVLTHNDFMSGTTYTFHVVYIEDVWGSPLAPGPVPNPFSFSTSGYKNPYILLTDPYDGETGIPVDRDLSIRFSKPMDTGSVSWTMVPPIAFSTDWFDNDTLMVLSHTVPFVECTQYTVRVTSGFDKSGNPLVPGPVPNPWTFYTIVLCPYVVSSDPSQNQTNVSVMADIVVVFSRPMNASSLSWSITPDPAIWSENWPSDNMLVLSHSNPLQPLTTYVLVIDYVEDAWGAPLCPLPFILTFTTAS